LAQNQILVPTPRTKANSSTMSALAKTPSTSGLLRLLTKRSSNKRRLAMMYLSDPAEMMPRAV